MLKHSFLSILLRLRQAATPDTKLVLADFVLPLACVDEDDAHTPKGSDHDHGVEKQRNKARRPLAGTVRTLAPEGSPLLPNLGKASAVGYWLDLTVGLLVLIRRVHAEFNF